METLWQRLVALVGDDDPTTISYFAGFSYATATRWRRTGGGSPGLRTLTAIVESLNAKGRPATLGQLLGTEPISAPQPGDGLPLRQLRLLRVHVLAVTHHSRPSPPWTTRRMAA